MTRLHRTSRWWLAVLLAALLVAALVGGAPWWSQAASAQDELDGLADPAAEPAADAAADAAPEAAPDGAADDEPSALDQQRAIAARYKRFDKTLLKMAEYLRKTDPERADILVRAIRMSRDQRIGDQMDSIVAAIESDQFGPALEQQDDVLAEMQALLKLLQSESRIGDIQAEIERIKGILKDLKGITDKEIHARSQTERGEDADRLADAQGKIAEETQKLVDKIDSQDAKKAGSQGKPGESKPGESKPGESKPGESKPGESKPGESKPGESKPGESKPGESKPGESKPGESKPGESKPGESKPGESKPGESKPGESKPGESKPGESKPGESKPGESKPGESQPGEQNPSDSKKTPGRDEIEQAKKEMERAIEELKKQNHDGASKAQDEALKKLYAAKEKLEEILRQLREEEREMLLAALQARFLKMLAMQKLVYQGTVGLGNVSEDDWQDRHTLESEKLAGDENLIALDAAKALELLREEGSSVAFPEAVEQLRDDMLTVARRLEEHKVGELTQAIERDIIEALGEILEALEKEMEKLKEQKKSPPPKEGRPADPPLVDKLAELKMLRSLQLRINRMTRRIGRMIDSPDGEQATEGELVQQLQSLGRRQARIQQATYDLATGRNQ